MIYQKEKDSSVFNHAFGQLIICSDTKLTLIHDSYTRKYVNGSIKDLHEKRHDVLNTR